MSTNDPIPLAPFPSRDETIPDITSGDLATLDRRIKNLTKMVQALEQSVRCMERAVMAQKAPRTARHLGPR